MVQLSKYGLRTEDTWRSSEPIDEPEIVRKFFKRFNPEVSDSDLKFLLNCIPESESAQKGLQNIILKLKLEFGSELATHNREIAERIEAEKAKALAAKRKREAEIRNNQKQMDAAELKVNRFKTQLYELQRFMENNWVKTERDVPPELFHAYWHCVHEGKIHRLFGIGRPYIIVSEIENPHESEVNALKNQLRRGHMSLFY